MSTGQWMITWFEPDIDEDKGEYISEQVIETPERPSRWLGHASGTNCPGMVVYIRGSLPMLPSPPPPRAPSTSAGSSADRHSGTLGVVTSPF